MGVYLRVLWRRIWIILVTAIFTVAVVIFIISRTVPAYTATAKLRVVPYGTGQPDYGTSLYFDQLTNSLSDMLSTRSVVQEAQQQLDVDELPDYEVRVVPNSELLQIAVTSANPRLAERTANTLSAILMDRIQARYNHSIERIEESLRARRGELEEEIKALVQEQIQLQRQVPRDTARIAEIERLLEVRQNAYDSLTNSYHQAVVAQTVQANLASVIEPASMPFRPTNPGLAFWLLIGGGIGLFGGVVLAFLLESLQPRLYSDSQIERAGGKFVLGHIPRLNAQTRNPQKRNVQKRNPQRQGVPTRGQEMELDPLAVEMIRRLRTHVRARLAASAHKSLVIAPTRPHMDNTGIGYNLAVSFALTQERVLLVDGDMRQPKLSRMVEASNSTGLSEVLLNEALLEQAIQPSAVPGLDILFAGAPAADSAELLNLPRAAQLVQELQQSYDVLICIGPPLLAVTDSLTLARLMGNAVITLEVESLRQDVVTSAEILNRLDIHLLGSVVMRVPRRALAVESVY